MFNRDLIIEEILFSVRKKYHDLVKEEIIEFVDHYNSLTEQEKKDINNDYENGLIDYIREYLSFDLDSVLTSTEEDTVCVVEDLLQDTSLFRLP
jgi:flagellar capping protein FliD